MCIGDCKMNEQKNTLTPRIPYTNLDIAKFICSLLVVMIHTAPFKEYPLLDFYTANVLARVAVPLFFGISGFLLFGRMAYENGKLIDCPQNRSRMLRYVKKTVKLYLCWSFATLASMLPGWYMSGWWGWVAVKDALHAILFNGLLHLWYLLAVIWAVPLMYVLLCKIPLRRLRGIALVLWAVRCLKTSYTWLWDDYFASFLPIFEKISFPYTAACIALPMMVFGLSVAVNRKSHNETTIFCKFLLLFGIWICEASFLHFFIPDHDNYVSMIVAPFFVYAALDFLTNGKQAALSVTTQHILRETNLVIYCLHQIFVKVFELLGLDYGIRMWFFTTALTLGIAYVWARLKARQLPARN